MATLLELFETSVRQFPDRVCLVLDFNKDEDLEDHKLHQEKCERNSSFHHEHACRDGFKSFTYRELSFLVQEIQSSLAEVWNESETKQAVGVLLDEDFLAPAVYLSILSLSHAFFPLSIDGLQYNAKALSKLGVSVIIISCALKEGFINTLQFQEWRETENQVLSKHNLCVLKLQTPPPRLLEPCPDLAYCITTSGSTSAPKLVRVPHQCIVPNVKHLSEIWRLGPGERVLLTSPLTFDPSIIDIFCTLASGACLVIVSRQLKQRPESLLDAIYRKHKVTVLQATPALLKRFPAESVKNTLLGTEQALRLLALGGEVFPTRNELKSMRHPLNETQLYNLYGITEVSCWATCQKVDADSLIANDGQVSIGSALEQTLVKLDIELEKDGCTELEREGRILIGSAERVCYIDDEPVLKQKQDIVWRDTGDIGRRLRDGSVVCLGRTDSQIKRNRKRLNLTTLDEVCKELPQVEDSCAVNQNERLNLFVVTQSQTQSWHKSGRESEDVLMKNDEGGSLTDMEIIVKKELEKRLPSYYMPDKIFVMEGPLPLTAHGKLDRRKLMSVVEREYKDVWTDLDKLKTDPESWMKTLWKTHLPRELPDIEPTDTFQALGGDSLSAVRLVDAVEQVVPDTASAFLDCILSKDFGTFLELFLQNYSFSRNSNHSKLDPRSSITLLNDVGDSNSAKYVTDSERVSNEVTDQGKKLCAKMDLLDSLKSSHSFIHKIEIDVSKRQKIFMAEANINENLDWTSKKGVKRPNQVIQEQASIYEEENSALKKSVKYSDQETSLVESSSSNERANKTFVQIVGRGNLTYCQYKVKSQKSRMTNLTKHKQLGIESSSSCSDQEGHETIYNLQRDYQNIGSSDVKVHHTVSEKDSLLTSKLGKEESLLENTVSVSEDVEISRCPNVEEKMDCTPRLRFLRKFDTKKCVDASPLLIFKGSETMTYIGSHSGQFSAIDVHSGQAKWSVVLPDRIESSASASNDGDWVAVGCYNSFIYILDALTGNILWQFKTGDMVKCSPVVIRSTGHLLCGSHDGKLYCLDIPNKRRVWQTHLGGGSVFSSPAVDESSNSVYAATLAGRLSAVNMLNGTQRWNLSLGKPIFSSLCLLQDCVLTGCVDGQLYCVDNTGKVIWQFKTGAPIFSSPVVHKDSIYIGSHDHFVYCLDWTGKLRWKYLCDSTVYATVFVIGMCVNEKGFETEGTDNSNEEFSRASNCNNDLWKLDKAFDDCAVFEGQVKMESILVAASTGGSLYMISAETGQPMTKLSLPGEVFSSPVADGKRIIVGCRDNFLYCFELS